MASAPALTICLVFFAVLMTLVVGSFAKDSYEIGRGANLDSVVSGANESQSSTLFSWSDLSFVKKVSVSITVLPGWVSGLYVTMLAALILVCILAWIRGL